MFPALFPKRTTLILLNIYIYIYCPIFLILFVRLVYLFYFAVRLYIVNCTKLILYLGAQNKQPPNLFKIHLNLPKVKKSNLFFFDLNNESKPPVNFKQANYKWCCARFYIYYQYKF